MKWRGFLKRVWGEAEGWAFLAYKRGEEFKQKAYKYPGQLDLLVGDAVQANKWADVYFCPHLFSEEHRQKEFARPGQALWLDKDAGPLEDIRPKPTICWQTSEGRYQAVWLLESPANPAIIERTNRYLAYTCNPRRGQRKEDRAGWHLGKIIRFPESTNFKYTPPQQGALLWDNGPTYQIEALEPPAETWEEFQLRELGDDIPPMPEKLPELGQVFLEYGDRIPPPVWESLQETPKPDRDWSEALWRIERLLAEVGLPPEAIFVLAKNSPWNKYARDGRPDVQLWREVIKATTAQKPPEEAIEGGLPWVDLDTLMLHSAQPEWLVQDIWFQGTVGWIAGVGKSYKSTLSLDLALSIATGEPFLGHFPVLAPGPVLMVQEEDPIWRVAHRMRMMASAKKVSTITLREGADYMLFEVTRSRKVPLYSAIGGGFIFGNQEKEEALEKAISRIRPRMVILDPWFMIAAGFDEYKAGEITEILNRLKYWRNQYGCAIAVVHHYNKGESRDWKNRLYGSMALYAWSESSLFVSRQPSSQILEIERDLKDARGYPPISVCVSDSEENYEMTAVEDTKLAGKPDDVILRYLQYKGVGKEITRSELMAVTGYTGRTISKRLAELEAEGLIKLERRGRGGQMVVVLRKPAEAEEEEGGIDLTYET